MMFLGILICIILAGFFAGMETGLLAANQVKIYSKKAKGKFYAKTADFLLHRPERLLATTLIGTNLVIVAGTVMLLMVLREAGIPSWAEWMGVFGLTLVFLVFSEIIPKSFLRNHADTITLKLSPLLYVMYWVLLPISLVLNMVILVLLLPFKRQEQMRKLPASREDLRQLVKLRSREIRLPIQDQRLIDDLFEFPNTKAREVMIPFPKMPVCDAKASVTDVIRISKETGARFVSVSTRRTDNIVGYIDMEDFLSSRSTDIATMIHDAVFYPETKRIPNLLLEMNQKRQDVVFLCDEYGIISGVITPAQIVADIVGHIPGENTTVEDDIRVVSRDRYVIEGTTSLKDLANRTGIQLERGTYDTIAGYLCEKLGEIPAQSMVYTVPGAVFKVLERDKRHIRRIEVVKTDK
ncbi:MAG: HlyC/CorC family transporter [Spirochaetaceae bacterium]|nr:MAG: HlyC/CorC family transporter [Spirochaetaceae bacterium]